MCGLVGYVVTSDKPSSTELTQHQRFFKKALFLDTLRGDDSTGIASITDTFDVSVIKKRMAGPDFVDSSAFNRILDKDWSLAMLGHNRAATKGSVTVANAHPFEHGKIILMHNGTLNSLVGLKGKFETDSEHIAYTLNECSSDKEVVSVLERLDGAFALAWFNSDEGTINLARNEERTLYVQSSESSLLYASEAWIIEGACSEPFRQSIKRKGVPTELPVGSWLQIDIYTGDRKEVPFVPAESWYNSYSHRGKGSYEYTKPVPPHNKKNSEDENLKDAETRMWHMEKLTAGDNVILEVIDFDENSTPPYVLAEIVSMAGDRTDIPVRVSGYTSDELKTYKSNGICFMSATLGGAFYAGDIKDENLRGWVRNHSFKWTEQDLADGLVDPKLDQVFRNRHLAGSDAKGISVPFFGPDGQPLPEDVRDRVLDEGCAWCGSPLKADDELVWQGDYLFHKECACTYSFELEEENK